MQIAQSNHVNHIHQINQGSDKNVQNSRHRLRNQTNRFCHF
jgi:hypothetical protein